jgi:hypothetical protein
MITQKIDMNVCNSFILSMIVREKMQAFATIFFNETISQMEKKKTGYVYSTTEKYINCTIIQEIILSV